MIIRTASGTVTRPSNTNVYAAGDLVANSVTAGSVTPVTLAFEQAQGSNLWLRNLTIRKTKADITNANFRVWFLSDVPTVSNGDNGVIAGAFMSTVLFEPVLVDATTLLTSGGAIGSSIFDAGLLKLPLTSYALIEARAAYTPASGEVFTLEVTGVSL